MPAAGYNRDNNTWLGKPINGFMDKDKIGLFGLKDTGWNNISGLGALAGQFGSGIMNYINGQNLLSMAKQQMEYQKNLANRNIANQAKISTNTYDTPGNIAAGMSGGRNPDGSQTYGFVNQDTVNK